MKQCTLIRPDRRGSPGRGAGAQHCGPHVRQRGPESPWATRVSSFRRRPNPTVRCPQPSMRPTRVAMVAQIGTLTRPPRAAVGHLAAINQMRQPSKRAVAPSSVTGRDHLRVSCGARAKRYLRPAGECHPNRIAGRIRAATWSNIDGHARASASSCLVQLRHLWRRLRKCRAMVFSSL